MDQVKQESNKGIRGALFAKNPFIPLANTETTTDIVYGCHNFKLQEFTYYFSCPGGRYQDHLGCAQAEGELYGAFRRTLVQKLNAGTELMDSGHALRL